MHNFEIDVSYSQIAVFNGRLKNPFNDWTTRHFHQGFSWRHESVSFLTLKRDGPVEIELQVDDSTFQPKGLRSISVPFSCAEGGMVEIASISDSFKTGVLPGNYELIFETGFDNSLCWIRFSFLPNSGQGARILIKDKGLAPEYPLLMSAEPA